MALVKCDCEQPIRIILCNNVSLELFVFLGYVCVCRDEDQKKKKKCEKG